MDPRNAPPGRWWLVGLLPAALAACGRGPVVDAAPLPARAAAEGGPLFRPVPPEESGIVFGNELRRPNVIPYVYKGAGCTVGDYDGDGLPDLYLVSQDGPNKLFRQVSPWRFEDVTAAAGVGGGEAWGAGTSFVDFDGDGDLDLYVCNTEAPNLMYRNRGDGTFEECAGEIGLAHVGCSTMAAFADYDNDGDVDVYLLTNRVFGPTLPIELIRESEPPADTVTSIDDMAPPLPRLRRRDGKSVLPPEHEDFYFIEAEGHMFPAGQRDRLFRNDGNGHFADVTGHAGLRDHGMGLGVVWWDFDDDGWLDIYVANDLESPDQLYRNRGDGTFEDVSAAMLPQIAYFGMGVDFADADNDGRFDLLVGDMSSTTHYKGKMLMGEMDKRAWFLAHSRPPQVMRNAFLVNTGTARFREAGKLAGVSSTDWTWTVKFGDLDEDGLVDLFVSNGIPRFDDNPDLNPRFAELWKAGQRERALDLARHIPPVREKNLVYRNEGGLHFRKASAEWGLDFEGVSHGAVLADLDRDGDLDVVVNNLNDPVSVYENRSAAHHRVQLRLIGERSERHGLGARIDLRCGDVRQTRLVSIARGYLSGEEPLVHFGLGAAVEVDELVIHWPSGIRQELRGLAADHAYTIREDGEPGRRAAAAPEPWFVDDGPRVPFVHRETEFDDFALQPLIPHRHSQLGPGIAFGDFDGDGEDDAWIGGAAGHAGRLLRCEDGEFTTVTGPWEADAACEDLGAVWIDHDGDGDLDLFVGSGSLEAEPGDASYRDRLYRNDGGAFARDDGALPDLRDSTAAVAAADFDRDGDVDLFVGSRILRGQYPRSPQSHLLRNDGGRFTDATAELAPELAKAGLVTSALWSDADGDGWLDLLVTAHWAPVRVFRNREGRLEDATAAAGLDAFGGLWNGIAGGDLDGDGDVDYLATNLGRNTKYKANAEHPYEVYCNDFDENGVLDVVEAKYEGDTKYPVRGRSCSSRAMPYLAEKFETYDEFARAPLGQIYPLETLSTDDHWRVTTLDSALLINDGTGRFELRALPHIAQIAPGFGVAIADLDADGDLDAMIAHNFYTLEPETGRMAGGLGQLLRNDGALRLTPVEPLESGIVLPGDCKALAVHDADGDGAPDLVVGQNDAAVVTLRNARAGQWLGVRVDGVRALGARVTVRYRDGTSATLERCAGGGYLTDPGATLWFGRRGDAESIAVRWADGRTTETAPGGEGLQRISHD